MFVAVYLFNAKPGLEKEFEQAWSERTIEIQKTMGSLGSRLHKSDDGTYVGYAQWSSRQVWESLNDTKDTPAKLKMRETCQDVKTILRLDVIDDLLLK